jgi:GH35 family endo-1,4-beta-xylanase
MSAQDAINAIKNIDYFYFGKGYERDLARVKQKIFKENFKVPQVTYVAKKYDNEYKKYLEKLAEKYNSKVDITDVDADVVGEDKAKAYRLLITPEMKKEFLNKGIEKLKEGGRVMKDYYNNYNTQRAI